MEVRLQVEQRVAIVANLGMVYGIYTLHIGTHPISLASIAFVSIIFFVVN